MSQKSNDKKRKNVRKVSGNKAFAKIKKSKKARQCTPIARYLRTGVKDHNTQA